jgi:hypothetical protein
MAPPKKTPSFSAEECRAQAIELNKIVELHAAAGQATTFVEHLRGVLTLVFKKYKHHAELLIKRTNEGFSSHNALAATFNLTANEDEKMPVMTLIEDGEDRLEPFLTVLVAYRNTTKTKN